MAIIKVSSKGQVVLPKVVSDRLGIKPGATLRVTVSGGTIEIEPLSKKLIDRVYGRFSGSKLVQSLEHEHAREIKFKNRL